MRSRPDMTLSMSPSSRTLSASSSVCSSPFAFPPIPFEPMAPLLLSRAREGVFNQTVNKCANALALARVALAGPRRQEQEEARVVGREHLASLVGVEHREQARPALDRLAVRVRDLDRPGHHE